MWLRRRAYKHSRFACSRPGPNGKRLCQRRRGWPRRLRSWANARTKKSCCEHSGNRSAFHVGFTTHWHVQDLLIATGLPKPPRTANPSRLSRPPPRTSYIKDGNRQQHAEWHRIQAWGRLGEYAPPSRRARIEDHYAREFLRAREIAEQLKRERKAAKPGARQTDLAARRTLPRGRAAPRHACSKRPLVLWPWSATAIYAAAGFMPIRAEMRASSASSETPWKS
jgi:hypothetical protein